MRFFRIWIRYAQPYHKRGHCEMKITGTKCYVQIEDDAGNIARFDGGSRL